MPRIRCRYMDCVFLEDGYCGAAAVELDPDAGCLTYSQSEATPAQEEWEDEEFDEEWEDEEEDLEEEEEDEEAWEDEEEEM
ncbi:MAG TPA: hypothetical protein VJJ70_12120 [Anaerolineales bacterium]|nr:hypothetical protein [Anaerolineales bacterium]